MRNTNLTLAQLSANNFDVLTSTSLTMVKGGKNCGNSGRKSKKSKKSTKSFKSPKSKKNTGCIPCYNPCGW